VVANLLGMQVRSATREDATAIARVHVDSWRTTYTGLLPDEVIAAQTVESREASWRRQIAAVLEDPRRGVILVAEDDDLGVVGFTSAGPERERDADNDAELYTIYLLEQHQGRRFGRLLFEGAVACLVQRGHRSMRVWVLAGNPAEGFYVHMGGRRSIEKALPISAGRFIEVAYVWPDLRGLTGGRTDPS